MWNGFYRAGGPFFDELPDSIQQLARLPLLMQLVHAAGHDTPAGESNTYQLINNCVRAILRSSGQDADRAVQKLADLAQRQAPDLIPACLLGHAASHILASHQEEGVGTAATVLVRATPTGEHEFTHDVLREYFLATRIAGIISTQGRSVATVGAFNDLATQATTSASARTVFEFVVHCLDGSARDLVSAIALSPTVSIDVTLPLMIRLADAGVGFATTEVLRTCARRCDQDSAVELARALLATPASAVAVGVELSAWFIGLVRKFGSAIWVDAMTFVEQVLDASAARELLEAADLDQADEAAFFARYFFLFTSGDREPGTLLETLISHPDWRVRAALAEGLRDDHSLLTSTFQLVLDRLVRDDDYKVRAAAASAVTRTSLAAAARHLAMLLGDENWHVRERALSGLLAGHAMSSASNLLVDTAISVLAADDTWRRCPAHLAPMRQRLLLVHGVHGATHEPWARRHALFALLRELRTGWVELPDTTHDRLVAEGQRSNHWLVQREANALAEDQQQVDHRDVATEISLRREEFRRLRGRRSIQVALDMHDLDGALAVARAAADAGIDFLEVGDPLIKEVGLRAVEYVKRHVPHITVVAEMMSSDWGRDQVVLAAEAGADVVFLIGPATVASVSAAVEAGRRLGVPILLDAPTPHLGQQWIGDMERAGVDGFAVTTNIDLGAGGRHPLANARLIRTWTRLPVAVSGGFSLTDLPILESPDWDIIIVGRSIADAVEPIPVARRFASLVHEHSEGIR